MYGEFVCSDVLSAYGIWEVFRISVECFLLTELNLEVGIIRYLEKFIEDK